MRESASDELTLLSHLCFIKVLMACRLPRAYPPPACIDGSKEAYLQPSRRTWDQGKRGEVFVGFGNAIEGLDGVCLSA